MSNPIYRWINQRMVKPEKHQQALQLAGERPTNSAWFSFNKKLMLLLGMLSLAFGVVFFFAFNWNEMGRMFKFVTVQLVLLALFAGYFLKPQSFWLSQALLLAAVIVLGALLALFGQTYQTGADPWQLFATWALLISPLVAFSRFETLWVFWAVLLNTALTLYIDVNRSIFGVVFLGDYLPWAFLLLNLLLLVCVEWLSKCPVTYFNKMALRHRWAAQILGLGVMFVLGLIGVEAIFDSGSGHGLSLFLYVVLMTGLFVFYRFVRKDLLLLTAWALAVIGFVLMLLAHTVFDNFDAGGLLLMAVSLIAMSTFAVSWIKKTHEIFKQENLT